MKEENEVCRCRNRLPAALIVAAGLVLGGFFPGYYYYQSKINANYVTVKGLAEMDVKADLAIWNIKYVVTSDNLPAAQTEIARQRGVIYTFLQKQGIPAAQIIEGRVETNDLMANPYRNNEMTGSRYIVSQTLTVQSPDVDTVDKALRNNGELVAQGIIFENQYGSPVSYVFTGLNEVKPQMLELATKNAAAAAAEFTYLDASAQNFSAVQKSANAFAAKFSQAVYSDYDGENNLAVSPVSVYMALALASVCTDGDTRAQLLSALNTTGEELLANFAYLYRSLNDDFSSGKISATNSVWLQQGPEFIEECINSLAGDYYCYPYAADFRGDNLNANAALSYFIKEATEGLIDQDFDLDEDTCFALVNTLCLKDAWNTDGDDLPFTEDMTFVREDGSLITKISMVPAAVALLLIIPGETGNHPFDAAEAETEICEGMLAEYSGAPLGVFKLSHAVKMLTLTSLFVALFLGGLGTGILPLDVLLMFLLCAVITAVAISFVHAVTARLRIEQIFKYYWTVVSALALISLVLAWYGL